MVTWTVEVLNETVLKEIEALPEDVQAAYVRLSERIRSLVLSGLESRILSICGANYGKCGCEAVMASGVRLCDGDRAPACGSTCFYEEDSENA